jgi:sialate O-acetylesterase
VTNFTAVGYFFGRDLHQARHVPIGLIHSSWGGTMAEVWMSEMALSKRPDFADALAQVKRLATNRAPVKREIRAQQDTWYARVDPGSKATPFWSAAALDTSSWKPMKLPAYWEDAGYPDFDGVFWFRRTFDLPKNWDGADVELHLGAVDDNDTTWVNGMEVGATTGYNRPRIYRVPGTGLKPTNNVIAVRVLDLGLGGGLYGGNDPMRLVVNAGGQTNFIPLTGEWLCRQGVSLAKSGWPPDDSSLTPNVPTELYNGMITPLLPYAMRGVIWYQGESNVGRDRQYRTLFPALIADWRQAWGEGDFPFLFVQLAPFNGNTPELREAQLLTAQHTTNTAMAVTIDCGDANDIHPPHKQPIGARLALAARALAYGEKLEYSGPVFESMNIKGSNAVLRFTHIGGGLVAKDGPLQGFTAAGEDKVFHPAQAEISGKTIVVHSAAVSRPVAVRYGWANVPEGNLFNRAGLPASPFRSDVD